MNSVERDYSGASRDTLAPAGAYSNSDSQLSNQSPVLSDARISKRRLKRRKRAILSISISDDNAVAQAYVTIGS